MLGVFVGSFGFPVFLTLIAHRWHYRRWTLHAKLTLASGTVLLFARRHCVGGRRMGEPATIGDAPPGDRLFQSLFASTMMRSGGFSLVDVGEQHPITLLATDALMFVGGGRPRRRVASRSRPSQCCSWRSSPRHEVTTSVLIWGRTIPNGTLRLAISVTFLGATLVLGATALLMTVTSAPLDRILFEVISAFATCGLSVGLSAELEPFGKYVLAFVMLAGRIGPIGLAAALAVTQRKTLFRYPSERPIVG